MPKGKRKASSSSRKVPYARGFKPPTLDKCVSAISDPPLSSTNLPPYLRPCDKSFSPLPKPSSIDDWLAQYKEPGQNFAQFIKDTPWLSPRKWRGVKCEFNNIGKTITERYIGSAIYLVPLGDFQSSHSSVGENVTNTSHLSPRFTDLIEYVEIFYGLPVKSLNNVHLEFKGNSAVYLKQQPSAATVGSTIIPHQSHTSITHLIESRYSRKTSHRQLRVRSILSALRQLMPDDALFIIALTMEDLYEDSSDLFVAGMAAGNHRVGVFSFARYDPTLTFSPEYWYDIKRKQGNRYGSSKKGMLVDREEECRRLILQRSCKLLVHELAHLFGVDHCIWFDCCMNGSGHLEEDFRQSMFLCPVDLNKLQLLCGFDVIKRYQRMLGYFTKHNMEDERHWVETRLSEINPPL